MYRKFYVFYLSLPDKLLEYKRYSDYSQAEISYEAISKHNAAICIITTALRAKPSYTYMNKQTLQVATGHHILTGVKELCKFL